MARLQPPEEDAPDRQRKTPKPWSVDSGNEASSEDSNDSVHPETTKSALTGDKDAPGEMGGLLTGEIGTE